MASPTGKRVLVLAIYAHVEAYPPSLNALFHLAPAFDKVFILVRNVMVSNWRYPDNVELVPSGQYVPAELVGKLSIQEKLRGYIRFGKHLKQLILAHNPSTVLLYDMVAFSLFNLFSWKISRHRNVLVWYHNHDVTIEKEVGRLSLLGLLKRVEIKCFNRAALFSLPNSVRLKYFPVNQLELEPIILPNYPSKFFFGRWRASAPQNEVLKLIFQGHIAPANSIESIIDVLPFRVLGRKVELHLAGPIDAGYQARLLECAKEKNVFGSVFFYGRLPYISLPELTASCHIGLAFYGNHNTMVRTMSTASNKIFEYASVGLPVIINKRDDMENEFSSYQWIRFSKLDHQSLLSVLTDILTNYTTYSNRARSDFESSLNFENSFRRILDTVATGMVTRSV